MTRVLFQGDSITDTHRYREVDKELGRGYTLRVASELGLEKPMTYEFFNRGVSGDHIVHLYARLKKDIICVKPDVLSILIGVNDVWHEINNQTGVDAEKFEKIYGLMIEEIKAALPNIRIMLIEPFVLPGFSTVGTMQDGSDKYTTFRTEVEKRALAVRRTAEKYGLVFIPTQEKLDRLSAEQTPTYWATDGVHPSPCGHEFLAREWVAAYKAHIEGEGGAEQ